MAVAQKGGSHPSEQLQTLGSTQTPRPLHCSTCLGLGWAGFFLHPEKALCRLFSDWGFFSCPVLAWLVFASSSLLSGDKKLPDKPRQAIFTRWEGFVWAGFRLGDRFRGIGLVPEGGGVQTQVEPRFQTLHFANSCSNLGWETWIQPWFRSLGSGTQV